ncbi:outer membrane lipoprotein carrier protein LolA [Desulfocurvibacter africanus]|uniref:Outer membrane lipoprotein carrier protein LolA n=2 Tax=Desulfocurvibacter africanus TaxID=873 RepID=F3Z2I6_DESAF|nr:outer membrane lipoprotein carrier protein LolA [Desulfocurvibacter africanus]EGJ51319.1 outer membrane lipoprotein carrier protein LolA [Desulfocurvibacter africanus subsp. africanus str. Walvis Bay]EMG38848.1 outer membrane lipoprotein-sorting protein [Desulfocurvibacter africanus PCS]
MKRFFIALGAVFILVVVSSSAQSEEITRRIQQQYETLKGFKAGFTQELTNAATGEVEKRRGTIAFMQPSLIRWETVEPEKELLIVGENAVWDYFSDDNLVIKYPLAQVLNSKTMIRFLSGKARFEEDFAVANQGEESGLIKIRLDPKEPEPSLVLAYIWLDPKTYLIRSVLLMDFYGNANQVNLRDLELNPVLSRSYFHFTPPSGVEVQDNTQTGS